MTAARGKVKAVISLSSVVNNYQTLCKASGQRIIPVVKSDAYGHGLLEVTDALAQAGATAFAVGSVAEGIRLRKHNPFCTILSLLGPVEHYEYQALWEADILGFIHCFEQLDAIAACAPSLPRELRIALKFDTGMRRLGFTLSDIPALCSRIQAMPQVHVTMVTSHLAVSDDPETEGFTRMQAAAFEAIRTALLARGFLFDSSISNSAATLAYPELGYQQQRAGITLYGVNPLWGTKYAHRCGDLQPAMSVKSIVLSVHALSAGQVIGYGCAFTARRDMSVAIVAAGYADGYCRKLSNTGEMCIHGKRAKIVGRISMQMTAIDVTNIPEVKAGDEVYLLGGNGKGKISIYRLSKWWDSIPAEVMNALSINSKEYVYA